MHGSKDSFGGRERIRQLWFVTHGLKYLLDIICMWGNRWSVPSFQLHGSCIWPSYRCRQSLLSGWTTSVEQSPLASLQATRYYRYSVHYAQLHHFLCRWWPQLYEHVLRLLRWRSHCLSFGMPQQIRGPYSFCLLQAVCMIFAQICRCPTVLEAGREQTAAQMPCARANPVSPAGSTEPTRSPASVEHQRRVYAILFAKRQ